MGGKALTKCAFVCVCVTEAKQSTPVFFHQGFIPRGSSLPCCVLFFFFLFVPLGGHALLLHWSNPRLHFDIQCVHVIPARVFFFLLHCVFPFNLVSVFFAITDLFASRKLLWNSSISLPQNTNKISDFLWLCTVDVNDRSWPKSLSDVGVTEWKRKALYSRGTLGEGENYESVITARAIRQFDFHIVKTHLGICRVLSCVKLESFCTRVWGGGQANAVCIMEGAVCILQDHYKSPLFTLCYKPWSMSL